MQLIIYIEKKKGEKNAVTFHYTMIFQLSEYTLWMKKKNGNKIRFIIYPPYYSNWPKKQPELLTTQLQFFPTKSLRFANKSLKLPTSSLGFTPHINPIYEKSLKSTQ